MRPGQTEFYETEDLPEPMARPMEMEVETEVPEGFMDLGDGSLLLIEDQGLPALLQQPIEFDGNLTQVIGQQTLRVLSSDLINLIENEDLPSRHEWEQTYRDGLKLLGLETEERQEPWEGACGAFHPILSEAVIAFQSNAAMELCPPKGPAKTLLRGSATLPEIKRSQRVKDELNHIIMQVMHDWRVETERMLFHLACAGTAFKKVYFDRLTGKPASRLVPAQDIIVHTSASGVRCPRLTHRETMYKVDIERLQARGFYDDSIDLSCEIPSVDTMTEAEQDAVGVESSATSDDVLTVYEVHVLHAFDELDDEEVKPYIVTILQGTGDVLSVRRNWTENDPYLAPKQYFVKYDQFPGFGFYSFGLIHLLGSGADAATAILRQIVDAATLANVPSGFKASGFRVKGDDTPLRPGEFRDVDIQGENIAANIHQFPFRGPQPVLVDVLSGMVSELRRVASVADMKIAESSGEAPVGTTLAILERSLRVMTAVHARLHAALGTELELIKQVVADYLDPVYEHNTELPFDRSEDFKATRVVPVSDPNAASQAQRVITYTGAISMATQAPPGTYNMAKLHRAFVEALELPEAEEIVPLPEEARPADPVSENMAILNQKPVKAFIQQDHEAHIAVHMAAIQSPDIAAMVGQSPQAPAIMAAMDAHIREHLAFAYRAKIEKELGVPLPNPDEDLPDETDNLIARLAAQAAQQLLQKDLQAAQAAQAQQAMQDPVVQMQMKELEQEDRKIALKEAELQLKAQDMIGDKQIDLAKIAQRERELDLKKESDRIRVKSDEQKTAAKIAADLTKSSMKSNGNAATKSRKRPVSGD